MKKIIKTADAPAAIGPYSQGAVTGNLLFTAGQIALDPNTMELVNDTLEKEVRQVMSNLAAILSEAGSSFDKVVKTTIFVSDLAFFTEMNQIYAEYFKDDPPARSTVQVARLPKDVRVEIDMIALVS